MNPEQRQSGQVSLRQQSFAATGRELLRSLEDIWERRQTTICTEAEKKLSAALVSPKVAAGDQISLALFTKRQLLCTIEVDDQELFESRFKSLAKNLTALCAAKKLKLSFWFGDGYMGFVTNKSDSAN